MPIERSWTTRWDGSRSPALSALISCWREVMLLVE
jgi:hypothetical protein